MKQYEEFIALRTYSRFRDDLGRRETWEESVDRWVEWWCERFPEHAKWFREVAGPAKKNKEVMGSMRSLQTAGKALDRDHCAGYNCSYTPIDDPRCFDEIMYILLCGTGVGFSVERQYVSKLPEIPEEFHEVDTEITVPDSKVGWANSFRQLISLLYSGAIPRWNMDKVRPAGERLKTFGGRSSGPQPLRDLFNFTVEMFKNASGRQLSSLECHDLVCKIGDVVVVGGVRRSALISLSNLSDDRMRMAKTGQWWLDNPQRALANNSACYTEKPEFEVFLKEWESLYESKSGERGIFSRKACEKQVARNGRRTKGYAYGTNPCSEIILRPRGFCNLTECVIRPSDNYDKIRRKVEIATIIGTFQSSLTDFRYLRSGWKKNAEEERLLGVSLTGIMDNPLLYEYTKGEGEKKLDEILENLRDEAIKVNKEWAEKIGINPSVSITCVKPSGTVSQLCNTASGIHPRFSDYYLRSVRTDRKDPLAHFMIDKGFPWEEDVHNKDNYVFYFPIKSPEGSVTADSMGAMNQLALWEVYQDHWCVTGDTNVLTDKGIIKIKDMVGHAYNVWNGEEYSNVVPYSTGTGGVYRLALSDGGYVDLTANHKLVMQDGSKKMVRECVIGETLFNSHVYPVIRNGSDEGLPDSYSQGFYSGDGYTAGNWTLVYPPKYVCMSRLVGVIRDTETSNRGRYWKHSDANVISKDFVPTTASLQYRLNWLAGLLDADGNKNGKGLQITSVDYNFLHKVKVMLTSLGCKALIREKPAREFGIRSCFYLNISGTYTRKLKELGLETTRVDIIGASQNTKDGSLTITEIVTLDEQETFCFTEQKAGRGVFNGILMGQCEHKPSMTCYYDDSEFLEIGNWVWNHFDKISGISFLPRTEHIYQQAPYQKLTEEEYKEWLEKMPEDVDWTELEAYESDDFTEGGQILACHGSSCEI